MAEKKLEDLPPSYTNLGFDAEPVAGPSAPKSPEDILEEVDAEPVAGPSAPRSHEEILEEDLKSHPPTATAPIAEEVPRPSTLVYNPPSLVFEEIYDACVQYLKKHCCYGSKFINQMKLTEITSKGVFHYTLESFGEKRESAMHDTPYKGGPIDGPENGRPPDAWDMTAHPPAMFQDSKGRMEIPHTASVHICSKCDGIGKVTCSSCRGRGKKSCSSCSGRGRNSEGNRCSSCSGSGRRTCWNCSGSGRVTCSKCDGYGKMKSCRMLLLTWKNHVNDFISEAGHLPIDRIRKAKRIELLRQQDPVIYPITNAPDATVNAASARLVSTHRVIFPNELILRQRHVLYAIPLTRVTYQWKEREGEFFVYGTDRKVYFEDYPQQCCCCTCC